MVRSAVDAKKLFSLSGCIVIRCKIRWITFHTSFDFLDDNILSMKYINTNLKISAGLELPCLSPCYRHEFTSFNVSCVMQNMLVTLAATSTNVLMDKHKSLSICKHYLWPSTGKQWIRWLHAHGTVLTRSHDTCLTRLACAYAKKKQKK